MVQASARYDVKLPEPVSSLEWAAGEASIDGPGVGSMRAVSSLSGTVGRPVVPAHLDDPVVDD